MGQEFSAMLRKILFLIQDILSYLFKLENLVLKIDYFFIDIKEVYL